jgi:hypothetical protein
MIPGTVNNLPPIKAVHIPVCQQYHRRAEVIANALIYEFTRGGVIGVVSEAEAQGSSTED